MRNVKLVNGVLWGANALFIAAIAAFSFEYLLAERKSLADKVDRPIAEPVLNAKGPMRDLTMLREMPNPLQAPKVTGPKASGSLGSAKLLGTMEGTAFLFVQSKNLNVNAYIGEPIRDGVNEVDVAELSGWTLKSVTHNTATFTNGGRDETLRVEETLVSAVPGAGVGSPGAQAGLAWDKGKFQSKKLDNRSNDNMEVWEIDRLEAAWAGANWEQALANVQLSLYPGGGVKIDGLPDGIAADRGFRPNDVVKAINGLAIDDVSKLQELMKGVNPTQQTMTIQVDRAGRTYTLQYQLARPTKNPN